MSNKVIGLIVLQADETIEQEFRRLIPTELKLYISRVPSGEELTPDTINTMEHNLQRSASLFPRGLQFDAVGYACTSGAAWIGLDKVAEQIHTGVPTAVITEPVSALIAACRALGISRLGLLSPYLSEVSEQLRNVLRAEGIETPVFASFNEQVEAMVARIDSVTICKATFQLAATGGIDGLFLSCTNLVTLQLIAPLENKLCIPVLSSNTVLAWDLCRRVGVKALLPFGTALERL